MTTTFTPVPDRGEGLRKPLLLSVALHILLSAMAIILSFVPLGGPAEPWGGEGSGGGGATKIGAVASLPGVPLPAPVVATPNTLATENPGLHQTEARPKEEPPQNAEEIPKFKEAVKQEKPLRVNKRIQKEVFPPPDNAVPFGEGGQPSVSYATGASALGGYGLNFGGPGGGEFGSRYSWYVDAVRNRIISNWLQAMISPELTTAPRVTVTFDILRDGNITNAEVTERSSIPEVDRSALRAVLASSPLGPLPSDYSGGRVTVKVYFDFHR
jgi:protein TonB